ncbi:hypothetical protein [Agaribacterium haliotis]|uniref:hypothetical protein n=1 Tax=Agaribacterium haliotis TaxID=2013869 RepID=UPI000BB591E5|nr:hypothetical protein [Agaribacterium haliotis]
MNKQFNRIALSLCVASIAACGGGSSDGLSNEGETSNSNITKQNKEEFAGAAIGALAAANSFDSEQFLNSAGFRNTGSTAQSGSLSKTQFGSNEKSIADYECSLGGKVEFTGLDDDLNGENKLDAGSGEFGVNFDQCVDDFGITQDGSISVSWSGGLEPQTHSPKDLRLDIDFSMTIDDAGDALNSEVDASVVCSDYMQNCEFKLSKLAISSGDEAITISDMSVSSDDNGLDTDATISIKGMGAITISGNDLVECEDGESFQSGTIDVSEGSTMSVMQITFLNCSTYSLSYDGETEVYQQ